MVPLIRLSGDRLEYRGTLLPGLSAVEEVALFGGDDGRWTGAGAHMPDWARVVAEQLDDAEAAEAAKGRE